jgi:hypothetical protein
MKRQTISLDCCHGYAKEGEEEAVEGFEAYG